jgi:hypothetical protein
MQLYLSSRYSTLSFLFFALLLTLSFLFFALLLTLPYSLRYADAFPFTQPQAFYSHYIHPPYRGTGSEDILTAPLPV